MFTKQEIIILNDFLSEIIERAGQWLDDDDEEMMEDFNKRAEEANTLFEKLKNETIDIDGISRLIDLTEWFTNTVLEYDEDDEDQEKNELGLLDTIEKNFKEFKSIVLK